MYDAALVAMVHVPFLQARDLALLSNISGRQARRILTTAEERGHAGSVLYPARHSRLYVLTRNGIAVAAELMEADPETLMGRHGLSERALLRRLPALNRLIAGRMFLLHLAAELARTGGALLGWRAFPVCWPFRRAGRPETLLLDGEATLRLADGTRRAVGYLWDGDAEAPDAVLRVRLERLSEARFSPVHGVHGVHGARVTAPMPPVLLVTASVARLPLGDHPGLLWTTSDELDRAGPLAAPWRAARGGTWLTDGHDLRSALARLGPTHRGSAPASYIRAISVRAGPRTSMTLQHRVSRVRATAHAPLAGPDLLALPLVLPPRACSLLVCIGRHPLLDRQDLATVAALDPFDAWELLNALRRYGLCTVWQPRHSGHAWRYSLTTQGTELLAQACALTPVAYRRIFGVVDDCTRRGERGLSYARTNLEHTDALNRVYLAFRAAACERGASVEWRGEWACTYPFVGPDRLGHERVQTLRPDAEVRYSGPEGCVCAFVEVDRGRAAASLLANKVDQYYYYRATSGRSRLRVLLITLGPGRAEAPLERVRAFARDHRVPLLDLRTTTLREVSASGPWAPIWRGAMAHPSEHAAHRWCT